MSVRRIRRAIALGCVGLVMGGSGLASGSPSTSSSRFEVTCEGTIARAVEPSSGLPMVVGACGERPADASAGIVAPSGPADCLVPGFDDRCEAWSAPRYDGPFGGTDYPGYGSVDRHRTVLAHPTEDLLFVGGTSTFGSGASLDADFVNIAYRASTGAPVWTSFYQGSEERTLAYESSIALSPDGNTLYALGEAAEPGVYQYRAVVVAFDALTGKRLWDQLVPISARAIETAMTTLADGTVVERLYAAGTASFQLPSGTSIPAGGVSALDPETGDALWTSRFPGETPDGARFNELVISPDGSTIYAGGGEHRPDRLALNFTTVAFRAIDGAQLWAVRDLRTQPLGASSNGITDMGISGDGSKVLVTGFDPVNSGVIGTPSTSPILTIAHDAATGTEIWRKTYGGPVAGETHFYFSLFQGMMDTSPDGRTAVITAAINSNSATATVAYDTATGTQRWGVESSDAMHAYSFTNYIGFYPSVVVNDTRAFVSNRRGFGYSQVWTVTTAYGLSGGSLDWTARLGRNRTLFGGNAIAADGKRLFVAAADQLVNAGFPAPDPGMDSLDIITVAYDA